MMDIDAWIPITHALLGGHGLAFSIDCSLGLRIIVHLAPGTHPLDTINQNRTEYLVAKVHVPSR